MKNFKLLMAALLIILFVTACVGSKEVRADKKDISGTWQLQTIGTEGITGKVKTQLLNEADFNCFVGSTWKFTKSNSLGSYTIEKNGDECVAVKRNIRWSVVEENAGTAFFQYKRVDEKYKDMDEGQAGFRFRIINISNTNMQLRSDISFENRPAAFIYNFVKN